MAKFKDIITKKLSNRKSFDIVSPILGSKGTNYNGNGCQGCGYSYKDNDVMIVEDLGPVCLNCLHDIAQRALR